MIIWVTQALRLQSVTNNPGILPVKLGRAYRQEDKWTVVKVMDLTDIHDDLVFNIQKYMEFDKLVDVHKPFTNEFYNIRLQTQNLCNITVDKFRQLVPSSRFKRGLLNPLGSLIKIVTGNLDHEDAVKYDRLITQIKGNEIKIDKKLTVISEMFDNMINSTGTLHQNTVLIDERLKRIERIVTHIATKENNSFYATYILGMFTLFINNFRMIYVTISEIETALALSKISVLHQAIVNSTELLNLLESISKYNSLVYPATVSNLVKIERTIVVKAYVKENQITFIMEIPLTDSKIYNYFKIYSLPIFNPSTNVTTVIIPKYPFILAEGSKYLPVDSPCEEIAADQFLCREEDMVTYPETTCVEQLMKFQKDLTFCKAHTVDTEEVKVQRIGPMNWIIYARSNAIITEKCREDVIRKPVIGTYLAVSDEDCEMYLGDVKLERRRSSVAEFHYKAIPIVNLPELKCKVNESEKAKLDIKGVNLDNVKHLSNILKSASLSYDSDTSPIIDTESVSLATIFLYIILALSLISFVIWKFKLLPIHRDSNSSDELALDEGGVMPSNPGTITVKAASSASTWVA